MTHRKVPAAGAWLCELYIMGWPGHLLCMISPMTSAMIPNWRGNCWHVCMTCFSWGYQERGRWTTGHLWHSFPICTCYGYADPLAVIQLHLINSAKMWLIINRFNQLQWWSFGHWQFHSQQVPQSLWPSNRNLNLLTWPRFKIHDNTMTTCGILEM